MTAKDYDLAMDARDHLEGRTVFVQAENQWYMCSQTSQPGYWSREDRSGMNLLLADVILKSTGDTATLRQTEAVKGMLRGMLAARPQDFNREPWLIGLKNGVLDLRTRSVRPVKPEDMLTRMAPVEFDPDAECPTWERHLRAMFRTGEPMDSPPNEQAINFLQRAIGASLVGEVVGDQFFVVVCGPKRTGKGVLTRTMKAILGPYATTLPERVLFGRADMHSTDLTVLQDARLAFAEELPSLQQMNVSRLKTLTGGDSISARRIAKDVVEFKPSHVLWVTVNNLPDTGYEAFGPIAERVRILRTGPTVPYDNRVADWPARIESELPGILNWALAGLTAWQADGYRLPQEPWMRREVEEWEGGQDPLGAWYDECLEPVEDTETPVRVLYQSMQNWWTTNRGREHMPTNTEVGNWLRERGHPTRRVGKGKVYHRQGVRIRPGIFSPTSDPTG